MNTPQYLTLRAAGACLLLLLGSGCCVQRRLLYHPTHMESEGFAGRTGLIEWRVGDETLGWARVVASDSRTWLYLPGNGGQAVHRGYTLHCFGPRDNVYILEYPRYGNRAGSPSKGSLNRAAEEAYTILARQYADGVSVFGESLGSGPACHLAGLTPAPARLVLVVPFARLVDVAQEKLPYLPVRLIMVDRWDNIEALANYHGQIDIYGAIDDEVIPVAHARKLAESKRGAVFHELRGGHNGWARAGQVDLSERLP